MSETASVRIDRNFMEELVSKAENVFSEEIAKIGKDKKVKCTFSKVVANLHATSEIIEASTNLIRYSTFRQNQAPMMLGQPLPSEEDERRTLFFGKFGQEMFFYPKKEYVLPMSEVKKYKKMMGKYKKFYKDGPMFFKTKEEYERSYDLIDVVEIVK